MIHPITFDDHVIGHTDQSDGTPEPVHVTKAYDMGAAMAHDLVYLDRTTNAQTPRIVVATDLLNALCGFGVALSLRMPAGWFDAIRTDHKSTMEAQARLLRSAGEHFLALSDAMVPDLDREHPSVTLAGVAVRVPPLRAEQPALQVQAQLCPPGQPLEARLGEVGPSATPNTTVARHV